MSLTRKHFIELAEIFRQSEPELQPFDKQRFVWENLRERIAEFCAKHNSEFDYDRFMKASENNDE